MSEIDLSLAVVAPPFNPAEMVRASIVDAATGKVRRLVEVPREALAAQAGDGEQIVDGWIARGKRWDQAAKSEVDDDAPPAPADPDAQWNAAGFRWISKAERNYPITRQIAALEADQARSVREITLNRGNQAAARQKLEDIDDQIAALRAKLQP